MKSSRPSGPAIEQYVAEALDARRVAQIEAVDLEPVGPLREVALARVALRRVAREAGRDDQLRAGAQELEAGLIADLDPAAGEQGHPPAQVGRFGALAEVELGAFGTELVVEVVDVAVVLLADVAVLRLEERAHRLVEALLGRRRGVPILVRRDESGRRIRCWAR